MENLKQPHGYQRNISELLTVSLYSPEHSKIIAILKNQASHSNLSGKNCFRWCWYKGKTGQTNLDALLWFSLGLRLDLLPSVHLQSIIINKLAAVNPEFISYGQIKGPCMIKTLRLEDFRFLGKPGHLCKTDNIQVNQSEFQSKMSLFSERF